MPPSAITVWALPNSDLHTNPTDTPAAEASMAALRPAPPAPMTSTSCSCVWYSIFNRGGPPPRSPPLRVREPRHPAPLRGSSEDPEVRPHAHRTQPDVEIRKTDADQAGPCPGHVP